MGGIDGVASDAKAAGKDAARTVRRHPAYQALVKVGLVSYGVVHLLIAWLGVQLALGRRGEETSNAGALRSLAETPLGLGLMWVVAVGLFTLVVWQVVALFLGFGEFEGLKRWRKRGSAAFRAVFYGYLGATAARIASGPDTEEGEQMEESVSAGLLALPFGQVLVGIVGLVIIAFGVARIGKAVRKSFNDDLDRPLSGRGEAFAQIGYTAKGLALLGIGALFIWAAWTHDSEKAGGLDATVQAVLDWPFGPWLVGALAIGIGQFGIYCFYLARHAKHA